MPNPVCSTCLNPRRAAIETALLEGESTVSIARRFGLKQTNVARHFRNCVKPKLQTVARAIAPVIMPPPSPLDILPSMEGLLKKLGQTIDRAEALVADAERDGGIAGRAVSINALKGTLVDTTKLLAIAMRRASIARKPAPSWLAWT
jgi:hypothetical protein